MNLESERLVIGNWSVDMAQALSEMSMNPENQRFMPDEVFETPDDARETIEALMEFAETGSGPQVFPIFLKNGEYIGHVEGVPLNDEATEWEIGYHIGPQYRGNGYAAEAVKLFTPFIMERYSLDKFWGICDSKNMASRSVLEKASFVFHEEKEALYHGAPAIIRRYIYTTHK